MKRRVDDIGFGGLKLVQDEDAFCYGTDAVLLANMACRELQITEDMRVCDLGTNTAIIPLIMSARCRAKEIVGVEVQEQAFELAQENLKLNSLMDRLKLVLANVKDIKGMESQLLEAESFDVVTTNPPYMESGRGLVSGNTAKAIARHELLTDLDKVVEIAGKLLKENGKFFMIHRPSRLSEIFAALKKNRIEPKRIRFVHPYMESKANLVLIEGVKGSGVWLDVEPPLAVYKDKNIYTDEVLKIYGR